MRENYSKQCIPILRKTKEHQTLTATVTLDPLRGGKGIWTVCSASLPPYVTLIRMTSYICWGSARVTDSSAASADSLLTLTRARQGVSTRRETSAEGPHDDVSSPACTNAAPIVCCFSKELDLNF